MADSHTTLKPGDTVTITGKHPWNGERGTLIAFEQYALGWHGLRVALEEAEKCREAFRRATATVRAREGAGQ
jgi:hypothetical protein